LNKIRTIVITLALFISVFAFSGCTETGAEFEFAVIFATGGLGDKSFNDAGYRGLVQANETYGDQIKLSWVEPETIPEFDTFQNDLADTGKYDLIICIGFLQTSALNVTARTYPDQKWVLIDDVIDLPNINSITFKEHEGSFLVGAMAAMTTNTSKLGFLGGLDIYLINKFRAGYEQGVEYIDDTINVTAVYSPDPTNPWGDIAGGKQVATTLYSQGIDIVYAAAGGTGLGVMEAADETDDALAIGVDSDQDYLYPGKILCSMLKKSRNSSIYIN
jgi:basic membrane protein A